DGRGPCCGSSGPIRVSRGQSGAPVRPPRPCKGKGHAAHTGQRGPPGGDLVLGTRSPDSESADPVRSWRGGPAALCLLPPSDNSDAGGPGAATASEDGSEDESEDRDRATAPAPTAPRTVPALAR